ncbi:Troponin I 4 [Halotydeus destructor]|nr:Troponin I 4 [Halotydeus destructor]
MDEKEKRKAEVRARLEAQAKKRKKAFMTPQRKKCLRNLLRRKAGEEIRKEQERKAEERRRIITERTGKAKPLEEKNEAALQRIVSEYYKKLCLLESEKYDIELAVRMKDFHLKELTSKVNYYRGKFPVPPLKKVSKTANQLEKIKLFTARVGALDYRASLKRVDKNLSRD